MLQWATGFFQEKGIDSPRLDAELLLGKILGLTRLQLYTQFDRPLDETELKNFKNLLKRRAAREPLAYILGEKEFFSLSLRVTPQVLIPRPETEELVERGLNFLKKNIDQGKGGHLHILDLATGSGCILVALLKNLPGARGWGVDQSVSALEVAEENAGRHELQDRVTWIQHDLRQRWPAELEGPFDLITANLPYVSEQQYEQLQPEIRSFEPRAALVPGPEGIEAFRWVLPELPRHLKNDGLALFEIGEDQGMSVLQLAQQLSPRFSAKVFPDLASRDRVLAISPYSK